MNENINLVVAWVVVVLAIAGLPTYRLLKRAYLIRQHKRALPGPLLGVVYPKKRTK